MGLFQLNAVLHMSLLNFMRFLLVSSFPRSCWIEALVLGMPTTPCNLVLSANLQRVPSASRSGFSDSLFLGREDTALVCGIYGLDILWHLFPCFHTPASRAKLVSAVPAAAWPWLLPPSPSTPRLRRHRSLGQGGKPAWWPDVGYTQPSQIFLSRLQFFCCEAKLLQPAEP